MTNSRKIHVFGGSRFFLRILTAYNSDNFHQHDWRCSLKSISYAFGATLINLSVSTVLILAVWYLIDIRTNVEKFLVSLPLAVSLLQTQATFNALMVNNRRIDETIKRLQQLVDERKLGILLYQRSPFFPSIYQFCSFHKHFYRIILFVFFIRIVSSYRMFNFSTIASHLQACKGHTHSFHCNFAESFLHTKHHSVIGMCTKSCYRNSFRRPKTSREMDFNDSNTVSQSCYMHQ